MGPWEIGGQYGPQHYPKATIWNKSYWLVVPAIYIDNQGQYWTQINQGGPLVEVRQNFTQGNFYTI